jgi:hypothetical protein
MELVAQRVDDYVDAKLLALLPEPLTPAELGQVLSMSPSEFAQFANMLLGNRVRYVC